MCSPPCSHSQRLHLYSGVCVRVPRACASAVFYAREADATLQFTATRRVEIKTALEAIVHEHDLQGTIMVRVIHKDQMQLAHKLPYFGHEEVIAVIRSKGS